MVAKLPVLNTGANDVTSVYKCDTDIYMKCGNEGRKRLTQLWDENFSSRGKVKIQNTPGST